jgi:hypothetical protein
VLVHVVLFTLDRAEDAAPLADRIRGMSGRIPSLRSLSVGVEVLPEARSAHLALVTTFDDADGLAAYAQHPVHLDVLTYVRAAGARALKVDYLDAGFPG